jgi:hypothetical protein
VALSSTGNAQFNGSANAVTFNTAVFFNGPVAGLSVAAPLSLTYNSAAVSPLYLSNASGTSLLIPGGALGVSITSNSATGQALYARSNSNVGTLKAVNDGASASAYGLDVQTASGAGVNVLSSNGPGVAVQANGSGAGVSVNSSGGGNGISINSTNSTALNSFSNSSYAVYGQTGTNSLPAIYGFNTVAIFNGGGGGVEGVSTNGYGVMGQGTGSGQGVIGQAASGVGVSATSSSGIGILSQAPVALSSTGNAQFNGSANAVTFNTAVYFNGPVVGVSVSAPLSLTYNSAVVSPLSLSNASGTAVIAQGVTGLAVVGSAMGLTVTATNGVGVYTQGGGVGIIGSGSISGGRFFGTASGNGVYANGVTAVAADGVNLGLSATASAGTAILAQSSGTAISATANSGPVIVANSGAGGGFIPSVLATAQGTNHAFEGRNTLSGALGILAGSPLNGQIGVFGTSPSNPGVDGESAGNMGVRGVGLTGVAGVVTQTGQVALSADSAGIAGSLALHVKGDSIFDGAANAVTFNSAVFFNGPLSGVNVAAPLSLTFNSGTVSPLAVSNASGTAILARSGAIAISATSNGASGIGVWARVSSSAQAIYAANDSGSGGDAIDAVSAQGSAVNGQALGLSNFGVLGSNTTAGNTGGGVFGTDNSAGASGVYGTNSGTSGNTFGVQGLANSSGGYGVYGQNNGSTGTSVGVGGSSLSTGGYGVWGFNYTVGNNGAGVRGENGSATGAGVYAYNSAGGPALRVAGSGIIDSQSNTVTIVSYVSFTAGTNLGSGVPVPLNLQGNVGLGAGVITVTNTGAGFGIVGVPSLPGSTDASGNPLTISAGIFGRTSVSISAGVEGISYLTYTAGAGLVGMGPTGIYGISTISNGSGGSFNANSGTAVQAQGFVGVSAQGVTAVAAQAASSSGVALITSNQFSGGLAMLNYGGAIFNNGGGPTSVTFNTDVFFNAPVHGIAGGGVPNPLNLTNTVSGSIISATNNSGTAAVGIWGISNGSFNSMGLRGTTNNYYGLGAQIENTAGGEALSVVSNNSGFTQAAVVNSTQGGTGLYVEVDNTLHSGGAGIESYVDTGGPGFGVEGEVPSDSSDNIGVLGTYAGAAIPNGFNDGAGVAGVNDSPGGVGVYGRGDNASNSVGVQGESNAGYGLYGTGTTGIYGSGTSYGIYGEGASSYGVYAHTNSFSSTVGAVDGVNSGSGPGVYGQSSSGYGIYGYGVNTEGIRGESNSSADAIHGFNFSNGYGVEGGTNSGIGVYGQSSSGLYGVKGLIFGPAAGNAGVFGSDSSGGSSTYGVYGQSNNGIAVYGSSNSGNGVQGFTSSSGSFGVYGSNLSGSGGAIGVYGLSNSPNNGVGVVGSTGGISFPPNSTGVLGNNVNGSTAAIGVLGQVSGTSTIANGGAGVQAKNFAPSSLGGNIAVALDIDGGISMKTSRPDPSAGTVTVSLVNSSSTICTSSGTATINSNQILPGSLIYLTPVGPTASTYPVSARVITVGTGTATVAAYTVSNSLGCAPFGTVQVNYLIINQR